MLAPCSGAGRALLWSAVVAGLPPPPNRCCSRVAGVFSVAVRASALLLLRQGSFLKSRRDSVTLL